jgi:hypothetical protein
VASLREISLALRGAWRLARLDRGGMADFDVGIAGFWKSFTAAALVYPAFLLLTWANTDRETWQAAGAFRIVVVETIGYVMDWAAFPLAMLPVARALGREQAWLAFIIAFNWSQVLQAVLIVLIEGFAAGALLSDPVALGLVRAAFAAALLYEWFIARVALGAGAAAAAGIVVLDIALHELIEVIAQRLYY